MVTYAATLDVPRQTVEFLAVLASQAPDLHEVLNRCWRQGMTHVILDGTLIASDRLAGVRENGNDLVVIRARTGTCGICSVNERRGQAVRGTTSGACRRTASWPWQGFRDRRPLK